MSVDMKPMKKSGSNPGKTSGILRAFGTVSIWTLASRLLGLIREMLMSRAIGASGSPVTDAFITAFRVPNMFRRFLAEGAFNAGFVPMFSKRLGDPDEARKFAQNSFSGLATITLLLIALVQIFTPAFVLMLSSGFLGDVRLEYAINYTHVTIFYILFMSLGALMSGVLNSYDRFALAAAAPVMLNVVMVAALIVMLFGEYTLYDRGLILSWTVLVGGAMQFGLLWWGCHRLGLNFTLRLPRWNMDMRLLLVVILPAMLTKGVSQINIVVGAQIASGTQGAQSWLYYAERFYQLPIGMIGVAIGIVLLPVLSRLVKSNDIEGARTRFNEAFMFSMLLALPASFALYFIPVPLVQTLYEGREFTHLDTLATASALQGYALAVPAVIIQQALFQIFFARGDTKTPMVYAIWNVIINAVIAIGFMPRLGYLSPVLGSVVSSWVMVFMLWFGARQYGQAAQLTKQSWRFLIVFMICGLLIGILGMFMTQNLTSALQHPIMKWFAMLAIMLILMIVYFALVMGIGKIRPRDLKSMVKR